MRVLGLFLAAVAAVLAQTDTAGINGFVLDATGAAAPGALVTAIHVDTGARSEARANESGFYVLTPLRPGHYTLSAELAGFKKEVLSGIELQVQQRAKIDFTLQVGDLREVVRVEGQAPLLSSEEASLGQVITNRSIVELPLNGRNYLQLGILAAGVIPALKGRLSDQSAAFVVNGQRYSMNNYLLDGVDNNSQITNLQSGGAEISRPSIDAIQEFKMQTANFSAEFGRSAGAVINVTVKSGTNDVHGTLYEFHRNKALDAKNFFVLPGARKPAFVHNQFGATLGGPLVRNKTFFFGSWEATRERKGVTQVSTVPTAAQRRGEFGARGMFDPATVQRAGAGFVRERFANNTIPRNRWDPVAARLIELYPQPTTAAATNNFTLSPAQRNTADQYDTRWDHRFSQNITLYGRLSFLDRDFYVPPPLPEPAFGSTSDRISDQLFTNRNVALVYTHVLTPAVVNEARFGYNRVRADLRAFSQEPLNQQFGIRGVSTNPKVTGLASLQPTGFAALGDAPFIPNFQASRTVQFLESLSMVRGTHALKFGADVRLPDSFLETYQRQRGEFAFAGVYTQDPQSRGNTGNAVGDFLLGLASSGVISTPIIGTLQHRAYQFYAQDDWKVTRRLTLNLGVRYELISPFFEKDNKQGNFVLDPRDPAFGTVIVAGSRGGGALSRSFVRYDRNNIAPRVGIAFQATPRTVIRAAAGTFYSSNELFGVVTRTMANPPFFANATFPSDQITPNLTLRGGFPADSLTARGQAPRLISYNPDWPSAVTEQWNFSIQRQLPGDVLLEGAYVGSNAIKLHVSRNVNQPRPGEGPLPPRRQFPALGEVQLSDPVGTGNYQSLQVKAEKRYAAGLAFLASYTLGKALELGPQQTSGPLPRLQNHLDLSGERARAANDARQRFVVSYTYEVPVGKERRLAQSRLADAVFGGWQMTGVATLQSGLPFTVGVGFDPANTGLAGTDARPDRIGSGILPKDQRSVERWFNVNDFVVQRTGTFGNAGRQILDGPGFVNFDLGFNKVFRLTETLRAQFRSEFFNIFNTPQFDQPGGGTIEAAGRPLITRPNAAVIARTISDARVIQLGMKLIF